MGHFDHLRPEQDSKMFWEANTSYVKDLLDEANKTVFNGKRGIRVT